MFPGGSSLGTYSVPGTMLAFYICYLIYPHTVLQRRCYFIPILQMEETKAQRGKKWSKVIQQGKDRLGDTAQLFCILPLHSSANQFQFFPAESPVVFLCQLGVLCDSLTHSEVRGVPISRKPMLGGKKRPGLPVGRCL